MTVAPVGLKAYGVAIAGFLEGFELCNPIGLTFTDGGPFEAGLCAGFGDGAFYVAVADAGFVEKREALGEGIELTASYGIAGVPVEHEVRRLDGG